MGIDVTEGTTKNADGSAKVMILVTPERRAYLEALKAEVQRLTKPATTNDADASALLTRLGNLDDVLSTIQAIPDPGVRSEVAQIDLLRAYGQEGVGMGLSTSDFEVRRAELLNFVGVVATTVTSHQALLENVHEVHGIRRDLELVVSLGQQAAHRLLPKHRLDHLPAQQGTNLVRAAVGPGRDVGPHRQAGRLHRHGSESLGHDLLGGGHQRGVKGPSYSQPDDPAARRLDQACQAVAGCLVPRDRVVARAQQVCQHQHILTAGLADQFLRLGPFQGEHAEHGAGGRLGGRLHGLAALLDQPQTVFEAQHAGEGQGGEFAQAQPRRGPAGLDRRGVALAQ